MYEQRSPVRGLKNLQNVYQLRFLSKPTIESQTADSLSLDNMKESQITAVEKNRDDMNNCSQETSFLLSYYHIFLVKHTQTSLT
jgi:hypothetical protein